MRAIVEVNKVTGEIVDRWDKVADCAAALGVTRAQVYNACKNRTLPRGLLCLRYASDYDAHEVFGKRCNKPIAVYRKQGASWTFAKVFPCIEDAARMIRVHRSRISESCADKDTVVDGRYKCRMLPFMGFMDMDGTVDEEVRRRLGK